MVQALHTPENILHVCIHNNVLTIFQQRLHLLVNSEQECIPVRCVPPAHYHTGGISMTETPP